MMFKVSHILIGLIFYLGTSLSGLQAQNAITSAGNDALGTGGSVSYSVGQIVYTGHSGTNGYLATGVHQPYEIFIQTGLEDTPETFLELNAYPNPTIANLVLSVETDMINEWYYKLFDINGNFLRGRRLTDQYNTIVMSDLLPAMYFLKVFEGQRKLKTFKIIKH